MDQAKEFLTTLFAQATDDLCIASFANTPADKHPAREQCTREWSVIERFIKKHDVPGRAVYMCVSSCPTGKRTVDTVGVTFALHVDLDFKNINATDKEIEAAVARLPLRPTLVVFSGHGLHLWWRLDVPCADHERMKRLQCNASDVLAGDRAVCHVAAVMRVPDSHNTKNGESHLVKIIQRNDTTFSIDELEDYFRHALPLLYRIKEDKEEPKAPVKLNAWEQYARDAVANIPGEESERIDHEKLWSEMVYLGENNGGNLHHTITRYLSSLLSRTGDDAMQVDAAIEEVCDQISKRIPEAASWNWAREVKKLRKSAIGWLVKKHDVLARQEPTAWLEKDSEIKAARKQIKELAETVPHTPGNGALNGSAKLNGATPHPPKNNAPADPIEGGGIKPVDLWDAFPPVPLPRGLLPPVIETYAFEQSRLMGSDASGLAMGALTACAGAIPDSIQVQVKVHDPNWRESARLWVALVGEVSALKSPIYNEVTREIDKIDSAMARDSAARIAEWEEGGKEGPKPLQHRLVVSDVTVEKVGEIAADNPDGLVLTRDELSAWFGSMERYAGRGSSSDRGFWLEAFNGRSVRVDRIKRGSLIVEHLGISVIGGVQPDVIRKYADEGSDDGLIQRCNPVIMSGSVLDEDVPLSDEARSFDRLISSLHNMPRQTFGVLKFTEEAQAIRRECAETHIKLRDCFLALNKKLSAHLGKYNGMFARMCVLFHCIENYRDGSTLGDIEADTARRVQRFMHEFMMPHAVSFYLNVLGYADNNDRLLAVASYILANKPKDITNRDVQRSTRTMRGLNSRDTESVFVHLEALGWVFRVASKRAGDPPSWVVNPNVYELYSDRGETEKRRRKEIRETLDGIFAAAKKDRGKSKWTN